MYLLDTNIFLEILLGQEKQDACKQFLLDHHGQCFISDFTLYSIGIVMFRKKLFKEYEIFFHDITSILSVRSIPLPDQILLTKSAQKLKLDYDDAYQYETARHYQLCIVTMDKDFQVVTDAEVLFL